MARAAALLFAIALAAAAPAGGNPPGGDEAAAVAAVRARFASACRCARSPAGFRRCGKETARAADVRALVAAACASRRCERRIVRGALRGGPPAQPPLPEPVAFRPEPQGVGLADPAFAPLPGARADFGRLGGAVYQIEMPRHWNGRLILHMHGFEEFAGEASVAPPDLRTWAILHGYAWGASSFSSTSWIAGRSADETAALWDFFARKYGRPCVTYATGISMGGAASHVAAERYPERFDGSLALCGGAGFEDGARSGADLFAAGAYVAGVTQAEVDAAQNPAALVRSRILPALDDPVAHAQFEDVMLDLTGGARAFDREGFHLEEGTNWWRAELLVAAALAKNADTEYRLGPYSEIPSAAFDAGAVRLATDTELLAAANEGNHATGAVAIPLLSLYTTGDGQVPIEQARVLRRRTDAAGRGDRLVQRVFRDAGHCGFSTEEQERSFADLVAWVERGAKPDGHDVLVPDLRALDGRFERNPRPGTPEAAAIPGAEGRVVLTGSLTVDGAPFDARFLGAIVRRPDGLVAPCQYTLSSVADGAYELSVLADAEANGCGTAGAEVLLWAFVGDRQLWSLASLPWPGDGVPATFDATFSAAAPRGAAPRTADFLGEIFRRDGARLPPGARVEAYVGPTLCGVASTRRTGSFGGYILSVVGPDSVPGCTLGARLTFRVDGERARATASNAPDSGSALDLLLPRAPD